MPMEVILANTARCIFPMILLTTKNFISRPAILDTKSSEQNLLPSVFSSAGTNGTLKQRGSHHLWAQKYYFIQRRLAGPLRRMKQRITNNTTPGKLSNAATL